MYIQTVSDAKQATFSSYLTYYYFIIGMLPVSSTMLPIYAGSLVQVIMKL
ncbi:hypothetical protein FHS16_005942 [Paenibacillus endophyticus]|uniref:Uncharacterized protein n=1 Tax=Paenibacillus endophyticus TaxID=1294268 RepID=A0A7W5CDQ3_9BACL|nr:hypothetical protein [Paenibacillus endophyticus]